MWLPRLPVFLSLSLKVARDAMGEEKAPASKVTAILGALTRTSVGFLTKEAGEDHGRVQETMVHKGATSVWCSPSRENPSPATARLSQLPWDPGADESFCLPRGPAVLINSCLYPLIPNQGRSAHICQYFPVLFPWIAAGSR